MCKIPVAGGNMMSEGLEKREKGGVRVSKACQGTWDQPSEMWDLCPRS